MLFGKRLLLLISFSLLNAETVHVMTARIDILVAVDESLPGLSSVLYPEIKIV